MRPVVSACDSGAVTCSWPINSANVAERYLRYNATGLAGGGAEVTVPTLCHRADVLDVPLTFAVLAASRGAEDGRDPPRTRQSLLILAAFRPWGGSQGERHTGGRPPTLRGPPARVTTVR